MQAATSQPTHRARPGRAAHGAYEDEATSRLKESHDVGVLLAILHETQAAVEELRQENQRLKEDAAALESLHERGAYLASLLAQDNFQNTVAPSSLIGESAAKTAAAGVFECAWSGVQPSNNMFAAVVVVPKTFVAQLEFESRARGQKEMLAWFAAGSGAERAVIEKRVTTYIQLREAGRRYVTATYPEAMARIWRTMAPQGPLHVALRQRRQGQVASSIMLQPGQIEALKSAWMAYQSDMERIAPDAANGEIQEIAENDVAARNGTARPLLRPLRPPTPGARRFGGFFCTTVS